MRRTITIIVVACVALIVLAAVGQFSILRPVTGLVTAVVRPIQRVSFISGSWLGGLVRKTDTEEQLREKNATLETENARVRQEDAQLRILLGETRTNERLTAFFQERNAAFHEAEVIGRSADAVENVLLLNAGSSSGADVGQAVVNENGYVIGTIIGTTSSTSTVLLITDPASRIGAEIINANGAEGLCEGDRGLSVTMSLIPQNALLDVGQDVITSGIESTIPRGLLIGSVAEITTTDEELFQEAVIAHDVRVNELHTVGIVIAVEGDAL